MKLQLIHQVLSLTLIFAFVEHGTAFQKPSVTKTFHGSSRAAYSMASSVDELWRVSDTVIEGVIEGQRPANHASGNAEIPHTMYVIRVVEVFKEASSNPVGRTILVRRVGGRVERPDIIEILERSDEPRFELNDRLVMFLKNSTVSLPPPNNQEFYVGTSLDSPDSFVRVNEDKSVTYGKSRAAQAMSRMSAPALRGDLRRRAGGR